jgi:hypothetical protein
MMVQDTIYKIRARIQASQSIREERRRELLDLLGTLEQEVSTLSKTHDEEAQSIAAFADVSAREATRSTRNPQLLDISLRGLSSSVTEFEKSHPGLVHIVNSISRTLANLGI